MPKIKESELIELRKKVEEIYNYYKQLISEVKELDTFSRELVNQLISVLQRFHEAIGILEERVHKLEAAVRKGKIKAPLPKAVSEKRTQAQPTVRQRESTPPPISLEQLRHASDEKPPAQQPSVTQPSAMAPAPKPPQPSPGFAPAQQPSGPGSRPPAPISPRAELLSQLKQILEWRKQRQR